MGNQEHATSIGTHTPILGEVSLSMTNWPFSNGLQRDCCQVAAEPISVHAILARPFKMSFNFLFFPEKMHMQAKRACVFSGMVGASRRLSHAGSKFK